MRVHVFVVIVAALTACNTPPPEDPPSSVVNAFFNATSGMVGTTDIPLSVELRRVRPYFSKRLHGCLAGAMAYQAQWGREHPDHPPLIYYKPPWGDGFNFTENEEGFTRFRTLVTTRAPNGMWLVRTDFAYQSAFGWDSIVVVTRENGRYVIDDVLFSDGSCMSAALNAR